MSLGNLDRYNTKSGASEGDPALVPAAFAARHAFAASEEVSLQDLLQVLRRRWPVAVGVTLATIVFAGVLTLVQTPIYRSQTVMLVEQRKGDMRPEEGLLSDLMGMSQARSLETQVEILKSDTLQAGALGDVSPELVLLPEKRRPRISVDSVKETDLIKIQVEDPKPQRAADIGNALAARYIRQNAELNRQTASAGRRFVEQQLTKIRADLRVAEVRLRDFRQQSGAVALDEETQARVSNIADTETARAQAETEWRALQSQSASLAQQLKQTPVRLIASSNFAENPVVTELQGEIAKLEMQRAGLLKEYQAEAPEVTAVQAQIDAAKTRIKSEVGKVVSEQAEALNPLHQEMLHDYAGLQGQILGQAARVKGLKAAVQAEQQVLQALPEKQFKLAELVRNATELEKTFELMDAKYHELKVEEAVVLPNARVVDPARPGRSPIRPNRPLNLLLGAVIGALLGLGLVFLQDQLDTTLKSPDELERYLGIPPLGVVALVRDPEGRLISEGDLRSSVAETFRMIRSSIQFASVDTPVRSLLVTSPSPGEGKSTTAANLAIVMAQKGLRVILVDCDLRRPTVHKVFKISNSVGLTTAVVGMAQPEEVIFRSGIENLCIVPAGPQPPNPAELLDSVRAREVFDRYRDAADLIVFDTPPCTVLADAPVMATQVDGAILVVQSSKTDRRAAQRAVYLLREAGTRLFGAVLNKVNLEREGYYYQSYGQYYYYYSEQDSEHSGTGPSRRRNRGVRGMLASGRKRKGDR